MDTTRLQQGWGLTGGLKEVMRQERGCWWEERRERHGSNASPLKVEYVVHMHPQLPHISIVEMVTQPPYTYLEGGATGKGLHFPLQV